MTDHTYRLQAGLRAAGYRLVVRDDHAVAPGAAVAQLLARDCGRAGSHQHQVALMKGDVVSGFDFTTAPGVKAEGWWSAAKRAMALALGAPACRHDVVSS